MAHNVRAYEQIVRGDSSPVDLVVTDLSIGTTVTQIVSYNPRRVKLHVSNISGSTLYIGRDSTVTATTGVPINPGQTLVMDGLDDYGGSGDSMWGISRFVSNNVHIIESLLTGHADEGAV